MQLTLQQLGAVCSPARIYSGCPDPARVQESAPWTLDSTVLTMTEGGGSGSLRPRGTHTLRPGERVQSARDGPEVVRAHGEYR